MVDNLRREPHSVPLKVNVKTVRKMTIPAESELAKAGGNDIVEGEVSRSSI